MAENNSSNIVAIVAIVVIVFLAGIILYFVLGGQTQNPSPPAEVKIKQDIPVPAQNGGGS